MGASLTEQGDDKDRYTLWLYSKSYSKSIPELSQSSNLIVTRK